MICIRGAHSLVVALALSIACDHGPHSPASEAARHHELSNGTPGVLAQVMPAVDAALSEKDPALRILALAHVAPLGRDALPSLEARLADADEGRVAAVTDVLSLLFLKSIDLEDVRGYGRLLALAETRVAQADRELEALRHPRGWYSWNRSPPGGPGEGTVVPTPEYDAVRAAFRHQGFAVPFLRALSASDRPLARAYAGHLLGVLRATAQAATLDRLLADWAEFTVQSGDSVGTSTVAEMVGPLSDVSRSYFGRGHSVQWGTAAALQGEHLVNSCFDIVLGYGTGVRYVNRSRKEAAAMSAGSVDEYLARVVEPARSAIQERPAQGG